METGDLKSPLPCLSTIPNSFNSHSPLVLPLSLLEKVQDTGHVESDNFPTVALVLTALRRVLLHNNQWKMWNNGL